MKIQDITCLLEKIAPLALQEHYDNAGLITGSNSWECTGIIACLDVTPAIINEALDNGCNLVVAHHPVVFRGLTSITGKDYVERTVIQAIKKDVAIYAIHTNLDNIAAGVSGKMAALLGLTNQKVLSPKTNLLQKLTVFVPVAHLETVRDALFAAGAGSIGNYAECSFVTPGLGSFKAGPGATPFVGKPNERHLEEEVRLEVIFPSWLQRAVVTAMQVTHPYEEVAHDIYPLVNAYEQTGSGVVGALPLPMDEKDVLQQLRDVFKIPVVRHTPLLGKPIQKVAVCGGAGSFLTGAAIAASADIFITADVKYHEFFDADSKIVLADIGHYESEQYTIDLLFDILKQNFPNFAVLKTGVNTNPVRYFGNAAE